MAERLPPRLAPGDAFTCEHFHCTLRAGMCAQRQTATIKLGNHPVKPKFDFCGSGKCQQGRDVRARLAGEVPAPEPVQLRHEPPAPPEPQPPDDLRLVEAFLERTGLAPLTPEQLAVRDLEDGLLAVALGYNPRLRITARPPRLDAEDLDADAMRGRIAFERDWQRYLRHRRAEPLDQGGLEATRATRPPAPPPMPPQQAEQLQARVRWLLAAAADLERALAPSGAVGSGR